MSFRRTKSGLSNFHLFVGADAVVFLEGGPSLSREEVNQNYYTADSSDICFWRGLFNLYFPDIKFDFRSVGSKSTLITIANDIKAGDVKNVVVALDTDFDDLLGSLVNSINVIYTNGYSWENCAYNSQSVFRAFKSLTGSNHPDMNQIELLTHQLFDCFFRDSSRAIRLDAVLAQHKDSLFDRSSNPIRSIALTGKQQKPSFKKSQTRLLITEARVRQNSKVFRRIDFPSAPARQCWGHLVAEFGYRTTCFLIKKFSSRPNIPKAYVETSIIEKFLEGFLEGGYQILKSHYDLQFAKLAV